MIFAIRYYGTVCHTSCVCVSMCVCAFDLPALKQHTHTYIDVPVPYRSHYQDSSTKYCWKDIVNFHHKKRREVCVSCQYIFSVSHSHFYFHTIVHRILFYLWQNIGITNLVSRSKSIVCRHMNNSNTFMPFAMFFVLF